MVENEGLKALEFALSEMRAQMERMHTMYLEAQEKYENEHYLLVNAEAQVRVLHEKLRKSVSRHEKTQSMLLLANARADELQAEVERLELRDQLR